MRVRKAAARKEGSGPEAWKEPGARGLLCKFQGRASPQVSRVVVSVRNLPALASSWATSILTDLEVGGWEGISKPRATSGPVAKWTDASFLSPYPLYLPFASLAFSSFIPSPSTLLSL